MDDNVWEETQKAINSDAKNDGPQDHRPQGIDGPPDSNEETQWGGAHENDTTSGGALDSNQANVVSVDKDYDDVVGIVYDDDDFFAKENVDMVVV